MKKTLLILCALLLTSIGASAQIKDVTSEYIQNPSFEADAESVSSWTLDNSGNDPRGTTSGGAYTIPDTGLTGWTLTNRPSVCDLMTEEAIGTDDNFGAPGAPSDSTYMLYLRQSWTVITSSVTQEVTLPAGTYMVTVDSKCVTAGSSTAALVVDEESRGLIIHSTMPDGWDTEELIFSLEEETKVSLGVEVTFANSNGLSVLLDNFKLYSIDYNVTKVLANPSFEDDDVADLTADSNRGYAIESLTGWTLDGPDGGNAHKDIMTAASTETDNGYGAPGSPSNGTQMLYLRDAWAANTGSVMQSVVLPAGEYMLTVDSKCVAAAAEKHSATLVVGEDSTALTIHTGSIVPADWDTAVLEFTLEETSEVELGVKITFDGVQYGLAVLLDNFQLFSTVDVDKVEWEMTEAGWGTLILPFAADVPTTTDEGETATLTLYAGSALTLDTDGSTLTVSDDNAADAIAANTPYLVKGTEGTYTFTGTPINEEDSYTSGMLVGTLVDMDYSDFTPGSGQYVLQNQESGLAFYQITSESTGVELDAYHCYLSTNTNFLALHLPGMETGIVAVEGAEAEANGAIYDLSGRRVAKAVKGVYIQNGKKVLVK